MSGKIIQRYRFDYFSDSFQPIEPKYIVVGDIIVTRYFDNNSNEIDLSVGKVVNVKEEYGDYTIVSR